MGYLVRQRSLQSRTLLSIDPNRSGGVPSGVSAAPSRHRPRISAAGKYSNRTLAPNPDAHCKLSNPALKPHMTIDASVTLAPGNLRNELGDETAFLGVIHIRTRAGGNAEALIVHVSHGTIQLRCIRDPRDLKIKTISRGRQGKS